MTENAYSVRASNLIDWLRDAHAMEQQAERMLKSQVSRLESYPELRERIELHLAETREQQRHLEQALLHMHRKPSALKDLGAKLSAFAQAVGGMGVSDEVVKGAMAGYVFEHMEIAAYRVLIAAAQDLGEEYVQQICEQILEQEIAMAQWLGENLAPLTQAFLERAATPGIQAKR